MASSSNLAFPEVMGKIKGRSFCLGRIIRDITSPSLSESRKKADCSFALSAAAGNNVITRGARRTREQMTRFPTECHGRHWRDTAPLRDSAPSSGGEQRRRWDGRFCPGPFGPTKAAADWTPAPLCARAAALTRTGAAPHRSWPVPCRGTAGEGGLLPADGACPFPRMCLIFVVWVFCFVLGFVRCFF